MAAWEEAEVLPPIPWDPFPDPQLVSQHLCVSCTKPQPLLRYPVPQIAASNGNETQIDSEMNLVLVEGSPATARAKSAPEKATVSQRCKRQQRAEMPQSGHEVTLG